MRVDDRGGTKQLNFSFLVLIGSEELSNRLAIALLPPRQPLDGGEASLDPINTPEGTGGAVGCIV